MKKIYAFALATLLATSMSAFAGETSTKSCDKKDAAACCKEKSECKKAETCCKDLKCEKHEAKKKSE